MISPTLRVVLKVAGILGILGYGARMFFAKKSAAAAKSPRPLGIVAHLFADADAIAIKNLGATSVRLSWYSDADNAAIDQQLTIAQQYGFSVILVAVTPITPALASLVARRAIVQVGNEPPDLVAYVATWKAAQERFGSQLQLWPAGLSNNVGAIALRNALAAGLGSAGILCLHVYGTPLVNAVHDRIETAAEADWSGAIAFTEIGTQSAGDLGPALAAVPKSVRTWVYALYSPDDGYTLTAGQRTIVQQFTRATP